MNTIGKVVTLAERKDGQSSNGQAWIKETLVIESMEGNNKKLAFEFFGDDRVKQLEQLKEGDLVNVYWTPDSTSYEGRWFSTLKGTTVTRLQAVV